MDAKLIDAKLIYATLTKADLRGANLSGTDLYGANLSGADLRGAKSWTEEQLREAESLQGATSMCPVKCVNRLLHGSTLPSPPSTAAALSTPPFAPASPEILR